MTIMIIEVAKPKKVCNMIRVKVAKANKQFCIIYNIYSLSILCFVSTYSVYTYTYIYLYSV
jgi:hypothetical protein